MSFSTHQVIGARLSAHLTCWLGACPPAAPLELIGTTRRSEPGWDSRIHPALDVADLATGAVLSVAPAAAERVRRWAASHDQDAWLTRLPVLAGTPGRGTYRAVFRWTTEPARLPELGHWVPAPGPGVVPVWLHPFGGEVLVATDADGTHLAGAGVKHHEAHGHELSVVTTPGARGHVLARALVAQAARRVLDGGAVPIYLHDPANAASARVAEAAGFPDRGWTSFGISETNRPDGRHAQAARSPSLTKRPSTARSWPPPALSSWPSKPGTASTAESTGSCCPWPGSASAGPPPQPASTPPGCPPSLTGTAWSGTPSSPSSPWEAPSALPDGATPPP